MGQVSWEGAMTDETLSRRAWLGGGAASAATAAFAALSFDVASAAPAGDGSLAAGGVGAPSAAPPTIVGSLAGAVAAFDFSVASPSAGQDKVLANGGAYATGGVSLEAPLELPAGSRLLRVDTYGYRSSAGSVFAAIARKNVHSGASSIMGTTQMTGTGLVTDSHVFTTPPTVAIGERWFLNAASLSASSVIVGAVYQYFPPNPELHLLNAPVRVYDSRAGFAPLAVTKGKLANAATRIIDTKLSGAVPAGASAALVSVTVTGTDAAGFLALYRNGIAWPGTSTVNWDHVGTSTAVTTVVAVDGAALLRAYVAAGASTDFLIDVIGFYA